ncbi:MAG: PEP-CTERM sorting domain-containing protein [Isosphaeraceae bacterium]
MNVSEPGIAFSTDEQSPPGAFQGNFAPGDKLLWTGASGGTPNRGPITLNFGSNLISGGGAQIMPDGYGSFTAVIQAFDKNGNLLGSFTEVGNATSAADNSAIFIGIYDSSPEIASIKIGDNGALDFVINKFDFVTTSTAVPEPASLIMAGIAATATFAFRRWRRAAK